MKHGKKYVDAAKLVDRTKLYDTNEALDTGLRYRQRFRRT